MSAEQSDQILQEVGHKIQSYPFSYRGAAILSGQEEGAYGWVTVNYLLENFIKVPKLVFLDSLISQSQEFSSMGYDAAKKKKQFILE